MHFYVDEEFAFSNAATIAALQPTRYANARHAFENGQASLRKVPPDGKGSIRGTFNALEAIFRLMCPKVPRLTGPEVQDRLGALLQQAHAEDKAASSASGKLLMSFREWIDPGSSRSARSSPVIRSSDRSAKPNSARVTPVHAPAPKETAP